MGSIGGKWKDKGLFSNEFPFRGATLSLYKCTCWIKVMMIINLGKRHNNYILMGFTVMSVESDRRLSNKCLPLNITLH